MRYQLASAPTRSGCGARSHKGRNDILIQPVQASSKQYAKSNTHHISRVVFPQNIKVPMELSPSFNKNETERLTKRSKIVAIDQSASPPTKKSKIATADEGLDKLDLLCAATLDLGPLQENPSGCSCPKSRCIALYCDCFKAGRRCDASKCSCLNCLNTVKESGPEGARSKVRLRFESQVLAVYLDEATETSCLHLSFLQQKRQFKEYLRGIQGPSEMLGIQP